MFEEDIELAIKVLIVGNGAVGKSSMIQRYCKGIFTHEYKKTIGVDFLEKKIQFVSPLYCVLCVGCGVLHRVLGVTHACSPVAECRTKTCV